MVPPGGLLYLRALLPPIFWTTIKLLHKPNCSSKLTLPKWRYPFSAIHLHHFIHRYIHVYISKRLKGDNCTADSRPPLGGRGDSMLTHTWTCINEGTSSASKILVYQCFHCCRRLRFRQHPHCSSNQARFRVLRCEKLHQRLSLLPRLSRSLLWYSIHLRTQVHPRGGMVSSHIPQVESEVSNPWLEMCWQERRWKRTQDGFGRDEHDIAVYNWG